MIERIRGAYPGRNKSTGYKDLVWTVATASDESLDLACQTLQILSIIEDNLAELGSDKSKFEGKCLIEVTVTAVRHI